MPNAKTNDEAAKRNRCPKRLVRLGLSMGDIQNHPTSSNNWRTSLVPAPAVIPAPRAYINAVAVKGFVVELWLVTPRSRPFPTVKESLGHNPRTSETNITGAIFPPAGYASNARMRASVFITVTKEVRPKQSIDMN